MGGLCGALDARAHVRPVVRHRGRGRAGAFQHYEYVRLSVAVEFLVGVGWRTLL